MLPFRADGYESLLRSIQRCKYCFILFPVNKSYFCKPTYLMQYCLIQPVNGITVPSLGGGYFCFMIRVTWTLSIFGYKKKKKIIPPPLVLLF